ncbi:MAG: 2-phosphosulfolactate phosphatase [Planctomycetes bacterium]|nr:2-phosphosulfolactate phosphatase [Planctomycetota bacterium]
MPTLNVHLLPELVEPERLRDRAVVVIDVLRATTTIAFALNAGAREVIPCLEVDDARRRAAQYPAGTVLLGGERLGVRIEGFDLGNSPTEYTAERVINKTVVFTTTNGTRAMERCRLARRVLLGALVTRRAVAKALAGETDVDIVCAGTRGEVGLDDALTAGAIAEELLMQWITHVPALNDQTRIAMDAWGRAERRGVLPALEESYGGRNLIEEGFKDDIFIASDVDLFDRSQVPTLDVPAWSIRLA